MLINRRATLSGYRYDAIGSGMGLSESATALTDTHSQAAFGRVKARTGTSTQPYTYPGNAWDRAMKLYDFHARTYEPGASRFLSKDPVAGHAAFAQTLNPYAHGINNPLAQPDPYGEIVPLIVAGAIVGGVTSWLLSSPVTLP